METGSPKSKIEKCSFKNFENVKVLKFSQFDVVREIGDTKPRKPGTKRKVQKLKH